MKILILKGGDSSERAVSLRSASAVATAAMECGHEVSELDTSTGLVVEQVSGFDVVLPILHGQNGEDGVTQAVLEQAGVPFLGADSNSSRLSFDKVATHKRLSRIGVKMPDFEVVSSAGFEASRLTLGPYVLKTIDGGSSVDIVIARSPDADNKKRSLELLDKYENMLLEQLIEGQEITVAVLGGSALPPIAINPPIGGVFDYENKYNGSTEEICPVPEDVLSTGLQDQSAKLALRVHSELGVRHMSRTDMIITPDGDIYVLELNTIPGMTDQSLFPKAAKAAGYSMQRLTEELVKIAVEE